VRSTRSFRRHAGRTEFLRARLHVKDNALVVTPLKGQGSHMIGTLKDSNALIRVEHDSEGFESGDTVSVLPLDTVVA
jgi:molybdopterin molybdotransferase